MFTYCNGSPVNFQDDAGTRMEYFSFDSGAPVAFPSPSVVSQTTTAGRNGGRVIREIEEFITNEDEQKVLDAKFAAFYKGKLVIKVPGQSAGFSCGVIFLGSDVKTAATLKHEYGHTRQLEELGLCTYSMTVLAPSVVCFALTELKVIPREYYFSLPWERKADELGETTDIYLPGSKEISDSYFRGTKLISRLFW